MMARGEWERPSGGTLGGGGRPPAIGQELAKLFGRRAVAEERQVGKHVAEIREGVDLVAQATGHEAEVNRGGAASPLTRLEQPILPVMRSSA